MKSNNGLLIASVVIGVLVLAYLAYDNYYVPYVANQVPAAVPEGFGSKQHDKFANVAREGFTAPAHAKKEKFEDAVQQVAPTQVVAATTNNSNQVVGHSANDVLGAQDLLPQCSDSPYAQVVPNGQGSVNDANLLNAGYHLGVDTVGSSLRNANLQLRSEPPNPQVKVSPWNMTTIEPDTSKRELEIGN